MSSFPRNPSQKSCIFHYKTIDPKEFKNHHLQAIEEGSEESGLWDLRDANRETDEGIYFEIQGNLNIKLLTKL